MATEVCGAAWLSVDSVQMKADELRKAAVIISSVFARLGGVLIEDESINSSYFRHVSMLLPLGVNSAFY